MVFIYSVIWFRSNDPVFSFTLFAKKVNKNLLRIFWLTNNVQYPFAGWNIQHSKQSFSLKNVDLLTIVKMLQHRCRTQSSVSRAEWGPKQDWEIRQPPTSTWWWSLPSVTRTADVGQERSERTQEYPGNNSI